MKNTIKTGIGQVGIIGSCILGQDKTRVAGRETCPKIQKKKRGRRRYGRSALGASCELLLDRV